MTSSESFSQYTTVMKMFTLVGPNLLDEHNNDSFTYSIIRKLAFVFKVFVVITCTMTHWAYLVTSVQNNVNIIDLSLDISLCFAIIEGIILYTLFYLNKKSIKSCLCKIDEQWRDDVDMKPHLILVKKEYLKPISSLTQKYTTAMLWFGILYLMTPLLLEIFVKFILLHEGITYPNRFHFILPFALDKNYTIYIIFYLCDIFIAMNLNLLVNMGLLILTITMNNLRVLFILLQDDFKTLFDAGKEFNEKEMKKLITHHICLINLVKEVSKNFGNIFALHLAFVSGTIAFYGLSVRLHGLVENLQNLCVVFIVVFRLFCCCLYGQLLSDSCVDLGNKICESRWYDLKPKHRKNMLMILIRSQRVTFVQSVSLMEISLDIFKKIIQMSWSLLSFTATMYQD